MTPVPYRLLVMDIDGTLIDRYGEVSPENREALDLARAAGVQVSLSTGRSLMSTIGIVDELGLDSHHIFFDGALVSCPQTGEEILVRPIAASLLRKMVEYARSQEMDLELYSIERYFAGRETWSTDAHREFFGIEPTIVTLDSIWEREIIIKAGLVITNSAENEKTRGFVRYFGDSLHFSKVKVPTFPEVTFNNILAPGTSKGKALEALAAHLGIPLAGVVAVGDGQNDISLLSTAGLGIAMGNAHEELKKVADHVTLHVEEHGLAAAIRKFLLD